MFVGICHANAPNYPNKFFKQKNKFFQNNLKSIIMSTQNRTTLKTYFETGDKPTQSQFAELIDSMALVSEVQGGSLPQTEHYQFRADTIQSEQANFEAIGVGSKSNSNDPKEMSVTVVKFADTSNEFALLGGYLNGLRVERNNIQNDGTADIKFFVSGLTQANDAGNSAQNYAFVIHNGNTGEIKRISYEQFATFVEFFANVKQTLKNTGYADINNAAATSEITIALDEYSVPAGAYVKNLQIQTNAFDNVSAIQQAYITLPGSTQTIDVKALLSQSKTVVIPITQIQELQANATQLSLTLSFDLGSGETNPQNFTQGNIVVQAQTSQNYMSN